MRICSNCWAIIIGLQSPLTSRRRCGSKEVLVTTTTTNEDLRDPEFQTKQNQFLSGQNISRRNLSHAFKLSWRMFLDNWSLYTWVLQSSFSYTVRRCKQRTSDSDLIKSNPKTSIAPLHFRLQMMTALGQLWDMDRNWSRGAHLSDSVWWEHNQTQPFPQPLGTFTIHTNINVHELSYQKCTRYSNGST